MKMHSTPNVHLGNNSSEITSTKISKQKIKKIVLKKTKHTIFFFLMKPQYFFLILIAPFNCLNDSIKILLTYNRGHPKVNDSLRKFPYFSLD
jgi:hypothetical protein